MYDVCSAQAREERRVDKRRQHSCTYSSTAAVGRKYLGLFAHGYFSDMMKENALGGRFEALLIRVTPEQTATASPRLFAHVRNTNLPI